MPRLLIPLTLFILLFALPAQAGIWPFSNRCDDIEAQVKEGNSPSKEDAKYYISECSGDKLEALGDAAAETAGDVADKAVDLWNNMKEKVTD